MLSLSRLLDRLSQQRDYRKRVYADAPDIVSFDPGHSAVMMCCDFHLTDDGPRLIEVNTNAGGALLAWLAEHTEIAALTPENFERQDPQTARRLRQMFLQEWRLFNTSSRAKPRRVVILDQAPEQQYLYGEMKAFAALLDHWGMPTCIASADQLSADEQRVSIDGEPVDLIYNRHCDFYLESSELSGVRSAYLHRNVCLSPNPQMYGLLADKRRMILWSQPQPELLNLLSEKERALLAKSAPKSQLLADGDSDQFWRDRKSLVFKPVAHYGSRGVLLGKKISRSRYQQLPPAETLVQQLVPPSQTEAPGHGLMKTDLRLYSYRHHALGLTARIYQGQVTNLKTPAGGFTKVRILD